MSEAASALPMPDTEVNEYLNMWTEHIGQVLTQIAGAPFTMESVLAAPPENPAPEEHDFQASVAAAGSLRGEMRLRVPRGVVLAVGQLSLQESQDATAELRPDHRDALQELLRQAAGQVATALSARWGETQLRVEEGAAPTWASGARGWLVSTAEAPSRVLMEWQLSSALVVALRPPLEKLPGSEPARADVPTSDKLDLLMDVELDVTLRFGSRSMLLRGILELDAGSVVELDRQVREPADLLLDGRLIARGEVVVVDGNYGLRVIEIVSPPRTVGGL